MSERLCLQWNDYKEHVNSALGRLRSDKEFTDVTLACEDGQQIEAHKVVLASSSPFFEEILQRSKNPHLMIYLKGFKSKDLGRCANNQNGNLRWHLPLGVRPPPPPPLMAQISRHFFTPLFSFAIESYIYETDFTLGLSQKYHF